MYARGDVGARLGDGGFRRARRLLDGRLRLGAASGTRTEARGCGLRVLATAAIALAALALSPPPAASFDYFDGRLEIHGFFGQQVRALGRDLDPGDGIELAQWYNVLGLEIEGNLAPEGIGPLEILEAFVRIEARYDCVWSGACGLFPQRVDAYGDEAGHLPKRLIDGRLAGYTGALRNGDERRFAALGRENFTLADRYGEQSNLRRPLRLSSLPGLVNLFGNSDGPNEAFEPLLGRTGDDPAPFLFARILNDCRFGVKRWRGGEDGMVTAILGPWNPSCKIRATGALRGAPNPWSVLDFNPILAGVDRIPGTADDPLNPNVDAPSSRIVPMGRGALPFRPAPLGGALDGAPGWVAQGLEYPSAGMARELRRGDLDSIQQNFSESELAWNRGASQQDEKELKEAYLDLEAAEGRLWMRIGKQTVVWGKTELFRNTDQFNPQDLALASLPGLEESRIGLWAVRGSWSFYNIGKFEDVRLEAAINFDDYEPADLGRCGEPFSVDLVCNLTFGYFAHGLLGAGLVGTDRPPDPWQSLRGLEGGARVEWRYRRFSFQLSNFNGFDDFPYPDQVFVYGRNVDPFTGMPRRGTAGGPCTTGDSRIEAACLGRGDGTVLLDSVGNPLRARDWDRDGVPDDVTGDGVPDILTRNDPNSDIANYYKTGDVIPTDEFRRDVIANHHANQTVFAVSNASTIGAAGADSDPALAGVGSFNGKEGPVPQINTLANGGSGLVAGSPTAFLSARNYGFIPNVPTINLVRLHRQPGDDVGVFSDGGGSFYGNIFEALGQQLTPQQEALLGCGPFWSIDCDVDGIDLLNAEGSVVIQAWPGADGTTGSVDDWRVDQGLQPGTVDFAVEVGGGPVATRWVDGRLVHLPGSRGFVDELGRPDPFYDPAVDGCTQATGDPLCASANLVHPLTGAPFRTELAAASWNLLMVIASRSDPQDPDLPTLSEFDESDPQGLGVINAGPNAGRIRPGLDAAEVDGVNPVACGILKPQLCENVRGFLAGLGAGRKDVRAGGNGAFGRRDMAWHSSGELVLRYERRNVLGFAFDVAEDRTKTNWGVEATWVDDQTFVDNDRADGVVRTDTLNLTVSVDRPTFINFLNPNRTILFNSQWFFQYIHGYEDTFLANGPVNVLATLTALTGYHQDRLLVAYTGVYDFRSNSGAILPQVTYRFSENLSASVGMNLFFGRQQMVDSPLTELRAGLNRTGRNAYQDAVENGLSALRDRDEVYMLLRYTF